MKEKICTAAGIIGGFFAALLGGWDSALITLVLFMGIDFTTGLIAASMGRSKHKQDRQTQLESRVGRACEKDLYSAHGRRGCPHGHYDRDHIYP